MRRLESQAADRLCREVGDLPLALEQAGAYIEVTGTSIADYLSLFRRLLRDGPVATVWQISFERISKESPGAIELLNLLALLAPDDVDRDMVSAGAAHLPASLAATVADPVAFNGAIAELRRYSLVQIRDGALSVHRLVQAVTRGRLVAQDAIAAWAEAAVRLVNEAFPFDSDAVETWSRSSRLLPHALAACTSAQEFGVASEATARLLNQAGLYLKSRAQLADAAKAMEASLAMAEKVYGPDHANVAIRANNIGLILRHQGDLEGALRYTQRALGIDEKVNGADHATVARVANNIGLILRDHGDLEGALRYAQRALAIDEKVYGPDHPNVARNVNNIGAILKDQGNLEGALRYAQRALAIDEKVYGPDHPTVARDANNIGQVLQAQGDLEGALRYTQRALAIDETSYGPDHPNVARDVNNIGLILKAQGDLEGALPHLQRAVRIFETRYGPANPSSKTARSNLTKLERLMASKPAGN